MIKLYGAAIGAAGYRTTDADFSRDGRVERQPKLL